MRVANESCTALTSATTAEEFRQSIVKRLDLTVGDTFALFEVSSQRHVADRAGTV